jgi:hypothetical protein
MDTLLGSRLNALNEQNDKLQKAEAQYLELEAHRKVLFSQLYLAAEGKNVAEKEANVYVSDDWKRFIGGLIAAETRFNFERRRFEILDKAFLAEYSTLKREADLIPKQGRRV